MNGHKLFLVAIGVLLVTGPGSHGQSTVGKWNLSSWNYSDSTSPYSINTSTIQSNGTTPVGLSVQSTSSIPFFVLGSSSSTATEAFSVQVPAESEFTYNFSETFTLSTPVNFGPASSQVQFSSPSTDSGVGLEVSTGDAQFITGYDLTFTLAGGAVFTSFDGNFASFGSASGVGTDSVSMHWNGGSADLATFGGIEITGDVSSFTILHSVTYNNTSGGTLNDVDFAEVEVGSIPEPANLLLFAFGGFLGVRWMRSKSSRWRQSTS